MSPQLGRLGNHSLRLRLKIKSPYLTFKLMAELRNADTVQTDDGAGGTFQTFRVGQSTPFTFALSF